VVEPAQLDFVICAGLLQGFVRNGIAWVNVTHELNILRRKYLPGT
jgi:hypothetical protein